MTLDRFRAAADRGRRAAAAVGMRPTTVTLRQYTYASDIADGVSPSGPPAETVLSPSPKVRLLSDDKSSMYGANLTASIQGRALLNTYEVGPITPAFTGGGTSVATLLGTNDKRHRMRIVLTGDDFVGGSEEFVIVKLDTTRPIRIMLIVQQAPQSSNG